MGSVTWWGSVTCVFSVRQGFHFVSLVLFAVELDKEREFLT